MCVYFGFFFDSEVVVGNVMDKCYGVLNFCLREIEESYKIYS